jgi:hypothetical protein
MRAVRKAALIACIVMLVSLAATSAISAQGINPEADKILKAMSAYLGGTKAFSMNADIDLEVLTHSGQKLQCSSFASAVIQRPSKLHVSRGANNIRTETIASGCEVMSPSPRPLRTVHTRRLVQRLKQSTYPKRV